MAFVNESIDTPERIREFEALNLISPVTRKAPERWRWTVDRERGCYLVSLGGGCFEIPKLFALVIPGGVVLQIEGLGKSIGNPDERNVQVTWRIEAVRIPRALASQASQLMSLVEEALRAHGIYFDSETVQDIQIELPAPTIV